MHGWEEVSKYLKRGRTKNRAEDTNILKRKRRGGRGQFESRGGSVSIQVTPFFMVYALPLCHQHQPCQLMINAFGAADEQ